MMLVALLLQAAITAPANGVDLGQVARFSRSVALRHSTEEIAVSRHREVTSAAIELRLELTTHDADGRRTVQSTDTRRCPAARQILATLAQVPMPRPDLPRMAALGDIVVISDGIHYSVTLPVGYGQGSLPQTATFSSNVGTPLARWVEASFAMLRSCWPDAPRF